MSLDADESVQHLQNQKPLTEREQGRLLLLDWRSCHLGKTPRGLSLPSLGSVCMLFGNLTYLGNRVTEPSGARPDSYILRVIRWNVGFVVVKWNDFVFSANHEVCISAKLCKNFQWHDTGSGQSKTIIVIVSYPMSDLTMVFWHRSIEILFQFSLGCDFDVGQSI